MCVCVCVCVCTALDTCQVSYDAGTTGVAVVFACLIFDWHNPEPPDHVLNPVNVPGERDIRSTIQVDGGSNHFSIYTSVNHLFPS